MSWRKSIQIYSFVFNTWSKDARPVEEQLEHPRFMDIGWTELNKSTLAPKNETGASVHIAPISSRKLGQGRERAVSRPYWIESSDHTIFVSRLLLMEIPKPLTQHHFPLD
jgi:hypothetical protein